MQPPLNLNSAVYNLQTYLRAISFYDERITRPPLDGLFDSDTQKAVIDFQTAYGIEPTGVVDKKTWDAIFLEYTHLNEINDRPPTPNFFPAAPEGYEADFGEEHPFITIIQMILRELSAVYDGLDGVKLTGTYDAETQEAISEFQKRSLLPITGKVDLRTWNRLTRDFFDYTPF